MALDPFDGNFSAKSLQAQVDSLRSSQSGTASMDMAARMRDIQAAASYESMQRIQMAQQSLLRSIQQANLAQSAQQTLAGQLMYGSFAGMPGARYPTGVFAGRNIGYTANGASTQSIGGLLSDAFLGRAVNQMSFGFLNPGYATAFGAGRAQVTETAQEELRQRFGDFGVNAVANQLPGFVRNRMGLSFSGIQGDIARTLAANMSNIRGGYGDAMRADGVGIRLASDIVVGTQSDISRRIEAMNRARGYSMTSDEGSDVAGFLTDAVGKDMGMQRDIARGGVGRQSTLNKLESAFTRLERALQANAEEVRKLSMEGMDVGLSTDAITTIASSVASMSTNSQFSNTQEQRVRYQLAQEGRSMYYGTGVGYAATQRNLAEALRDRMMGQGDFGRAELYRFGGSNATEAAMMHQRHTMAQNEAWVGRFGSSYGLAALAGGPNITSIGDLSSRLSGAYGQDPFAYINMMSNESSRQFLSENADLISYTAAMATGATHPGKEKEIAIASLAKQHGISIPEAAAMYQRLSREENSFNKQASRLGMSARDLMSISRQFTRVGLSMPDTAGLSGLTGRVPSVGDMIGVIGDSELSLYKDRMVRSHQQGMMSVDQMAEMNESDLIAYLEKLVASGTISEAQVKELLPDAMIGYSSAINDDGERQQVAKINRSRLSHSTSLLRTADRLSRGTPLERIIGTSAGMGGSILGAWTGLDKDTLGKWSGLNPLAMSKDAQLLQRQIGLLGGGDEEQQRIMGEIVTLLNADTGAGSVSVSDLKGDTGKLQSILNSGMVTSSEMIRVGQYIDTTRQMREIKMAPPVNVNISSIDARVAERLRGQP